MQSQFCQRNKPAAGHVLNDGNRVNDLLQAAP